MKIYNETILTANVYKLDLTNNKISQNKHRVHPPLIPHLNNNVGWHMLEPDIYPFSKCPKCY